MLVYIKQSEKPDRHTCTHVMCRDFSAIWKRVMPVSIALALNITPAFAELPVPGTAFVHAGDAAYLFNDSNLTVNQSSDRVILNWESFNVGAENSVTFNQPDSSSIALNRIFQSDPSKILGSINANGQIYLYNQNGFIFGEGVRFNANNIVATTLDVDNDLFMGSSVLNAIENQQPAFFDSTGNNTGKIEVRPGAEINAETILMIAPEIVNQGVLNSADGQTILAASKDKVYLAASDKDSDLRGLLVEVGTGGTVTNAAAGSINAERGNVTLIGYAVNQNGRIRATTSVDKNGSIRLLARDNADTFENNENNFSSNKESIGVDERPTAEFLALAERSGQVVLGEGSSTEIAVDSDTITMVPDAQEQLQSKVEIVGKEIWMKQGSKIIAPSGEVKVTATDSPDNPMANGTGRNDSYVYMDAGSVIDVSGTDTSVLPMERNSVAVEVRSNELADSPLQRGGVLQGQTVYIDLRKGTDLVDYSGALATVEKSVTERLSAGGKIDIRSEGDFVQRDGAVLDISGGKVTYEDGFIKETRLISQGQIINISDADKFRTYDGLLGVNSKTHERWAVTEYFNSSSGFASGRFVTGFEEGKAAGSVDISAASAQMAPSGIKADTTIGPYQTEADLLPAPGELDINLAYFIDSAQGVTFLLESLLEEISDDIAGAPDAASLQRENLAADLVLPDSYLQDSGLGKLTINTFNEITIDDSATIEARPGSEISLGGSTVTVNGDIVNHAGIVSLSAVPVINGGRANLFMADNARIDVSGYWINNSDLGGKKSLDFPELVDGGVIKLYAEGDVTIGKGSLLNASAGAMIDEDFDLSAGTGGDISLIAGHRDGSSLTVNGDLESYSLTSGGTLHLESASVLVSDDVDTVTDANQLVLGSEVFETGGFGRYEVVANAGDLVVDTVISPIMQNLVFNDATVSTAGASTNSGSTLPLITTGTKVTDITHVTTLASFERQPVDLDFALRQIDTDTVHNLAITDQAMINVDPGARLSLSSDTRIHVGGKINAPAADVSLAINSPATETGFLSDQAIWLSDGSEINVSSTVVYEHNDLGLRIGEVFDAGSVSFKANRGYVVIQEGARVDVSAKTETVDLLVKTNADGPEYKAFDIAPDAGQISMLAAEGIVIDGELIAGASTFKGAKAGELSIALNTNIRSISIEDSNNLGANKFDFSARDIVVVDSVGKRLDDAAIFGDNIDESLQGIAFLDVASVERSGFDTVKLKTDHVVTSQSTAASEIRFESDVDLTVKNSIVFSAPTINSNDRDVNLDAAYVALGSDSRSRNSVSVVPVPGSGSFNVNAALIDIIGDVRITKTAAVNQKASDDIRFIGARTVQQPEQLTGSLSAASDINLTASQVYPATYSQVSIDLVNNASGAVTIAGNGEAVPVLSALGGMTINAPDIVQGGVIKAPLGTISLNATENISLLPDSVTSISAEGQIIPFGKTINAGGNWTYTITTPLNVELADKSVELKAPNIKMLDGSVVDISGGGDIVAYEFVSGPTGSSDVLLQENAAGAFAILPSSGNRYAPYDFLASSDTSNVGQQVYLEAGKDFAAGYYTILPARYALLPGAKLVTPVESDTAIFPGDSFTRVDGASIHAGKYATANTDIVDSIYSAFIVEDGTVARARSEFIETSANQFFTTRLPEDAGALVINTENSLTLAGIIRGEHAEGTAGSRLDILADNIEVIAAGSDTSNTGFVQLIDSNLSELSVDSLMLGGKRRIGDAETMVAVQSDSVVIREDVSLVLPEIVLVAKNRIETEVGSIINGKAEALAQNSENIVLDSNASIVGVTVNVLPVISRTGTGDGATINLAKGSSLAADNSIFVNSSDDVTLMADILLDGGNLGIGAKSVSLGTAPSGEPGLNLSSELIESLQVEQLEIASIESITIFDDIDLAFSNLTLTAPGINGRSVDGVKVQLTASGDVVLRQSGFTATPGASGLGSISIMADNIVLKGGNEAFLFDGFGDARFTASHSITGAGDGDSADDIVNNVFDFGLASVVLDAPLVTGEAGSALVLNSRSDVAMLNTAGTVVDAEDVYALGATFIVNADEVMVDTNVVFPSGLIALNADGETGNENVSMSSAALLDVSGRTLNYVDGSQAGSSGGVVSLSSATGYVQAGAGSRIDISAADVAGDSGELVLSAIADTVHIDGDIETAHAEEFAGGSIRIDVDHVADLPALMQRLQADDFSNRQSYRVRSGDIVISGLAGDAANIASGEIGLTADNGAISISGKLDASGKNAGMIEVYASSDIDISGAILDAFATDAASGGKLVLATSNGQLSADNTTQIDVAGNIAGTAVDSGSVSLRAPRTNSNSDIAVTEFDAGVAGAERIDIEAFARYNDAIIDNAQQAVYSNDAAAWLANAAAISNRLGLSADSRVHYLAGIEVFNSGDITVSEEVDFYQWQLVSADAVDEGSFTLRAGNNLHINASISDAVNIELINSFTFAEAPVIKNGESWNYRLVSGADLNSANLMATNHDDSSDTGNLTLAANVAVRTGKGNIDIASGGDLVLAEQTSVIYTVGQGNGVGRFIPEFVDFGAIPDGPQFPDQGGDIGIDVAGDITAAVSDQFFTDWLQRVGGVTNLDADAIPGMRAVVIKDFEQGIATLGGGDIDIVAGGDITNLSVSTPQTGQIDDSNEVILRGGGNIYLESGGDIRSARILADGGEASIHARGDVSSDTGGLNTLIALGDAEVSIEAGGDIDIEGIGNITMLPLSTLQSSTFVSLSDTRNTAYFFTYTDRSAVDLLSCFGDITLHNDIEAIKVAPSNRFSGSSVFPWSVYPGEFSATTLSGNIAIDNSFTLFPDVDGNLGLHAAGDIVSRKGESLRQQVFVSVSDVAISALPSIYSPENTLAGSSTTEARLKGATTEHSILHDENGPLHLNDDEPLLVVANNDITGNGELKLRSPKQTRVVAGNDISDFGIEIQNISASDKSMVIAGGDISYSLPDTGSTIVSDGIRLTGPGSVTVLAGGDISLGISKGIRSLGNVDNPVLPSLGGDIAVFAGIENTGLNDELDTTRFISTYFKGEVRGDAALIDIDVAGYQQMLIDYVLSDRYNGDLMQAVAEATSLSYSSKDEAIAAFRTLDESQQVEVAINSYSRSSVSEQRKLIIDVFVTELNLAAEAVAKTEDDSEYARGFLAINSLFASPVSNETLLTTASALAADEGHGDISLPFSRILSTAGGDINIFAPYGELNVGFTAEVANASPGAGSLGVVISGQGDLSAMTESNINVNLSRMQALDGGDISLWSSSGDIDAGRGAKTALTIPPPLTVVDKNTGQIQIIFPPAVSGSGINAGVSSEGLEPGKVTLAAPGGVVNASDGGIGSAGDLVVAATKVLGGDNFSAGGATVGVPIATNVTAGLSGLSSSTDSAVNSATNAAASAAASAASNDAGVALVTVELLATEDEF
jgi:filamentous hemagglutinin